MAIEPERRYTERETALILKLAAQLEEFAPADLVPSGHTIAEIERIATEAGIDPEAVQRAAAALSAEEPGTLERIIGGPTTFQLERTVGGDLDNRELDELVETIRWTLAKSGDVRELSDGIEWTHKTDEGPLIQAQIATRYGRTRIRLLGRYDDPAHWTLIGAGVAATAASALVWTTLEPSFLLGTGISAGLVGVAWTGTRAFWRLVARRTDRRFRHLLERLTDQTARLTEHPIGESTPKEE